MQGNVSVYKRLDLIASKINHYERLFVRDASLIKRRIFRENASEPCYGDMQIIDDNINAFKGYCERQRSLIRVIKQKGSKNDDSRNKEKGKPSSVN